MEAHPRADWYIEDWEREIESLTVEIERLRSALRVIQENYTKRGLIKRVCAQTLQTKDSEGLPCCGSESGVHLIGCDSEDAGRIHRVSTKTGEPCQECGEPMPHELRECKLPEKDSD